MRAKTSLKIAALLSFAAFLSLLATIIVNLWFMGRGDQQILALFGQSLQYRIRCDHPESSPIFNPNGNLIDDHLQLNTLLFDETSKMIASNWSHKNQHPIPANIEQAKRLVAEASQKPLFFGPGPWVSITNICQRPWTLFVNDPNNKLFRITIFNRQRNLFILTSLSFAVLIFSFWFYLSSKGQEATEVLRSFTRGQLDAQLRIRKWERSFELLHEFNRMANQLKNLFLRNRNLELSRSELLTELAHDTRTPIASLRSALDTLGEFHVQMNQKQLEQILDHMNQDLAYFSNLIEDLFLLSELDSMEDAPPNDTVNLSQLLSASVDLVFHRSNTTTKDSLCIKTALNENCTIAGDGHLIQRMLQNFLENARRYAIKNVLVELRISETLAHIAIQNDSRPLSETELKSWGEKRKSRIINNQRTQAHTSLGLGSSIGCRIAALHGGHARIEQQVSASNNQQALITVHVQLPIAPDRDQAAIPTSDD